MNKMKATQLNCNLLDVRKKPAQPWRRRILFAIMICAVVVVALAAGDGARDPVLRIIDIGGTQPAAEQREMLGAVRIAVSGVGENRNDVGIVAGVVEARARRRHAPDRSLRFGKENSTEGVIFFDRPSRGGAFIDGQPGPYLQIARLRASTVLPNQRNDIRDVGGSNGSQSIGTNIAHSDERSLSSARGLVGPPEQPAMDYQYQERRDAYEQQARRQPVYGDVISKRLPFIFEMLGLALAWFLGWVFMAKFTEIVIFRFDRHKSSLEGGLYLFISLSLAVVGAVIYYFTITS
jgi:hypothetical protein